MADLKEVCDHSNTQPKDCSYAWLYESAEAEWRRNPSPYNELLVTDAAKLINDINDPDGSAPERRMNIISEITAFEANRKLPHVLFDSTQGNKIVGPDRSNI